MILFYITLRKENKNIEFMKYEVKDLSAMYLFFQPLQGAYPLIDSIGT